MKISRILCRQKIEKNKTSRSNIEGADTSGTVKLLQTIIRLTSSRCGEGENWTSRSAGPWSSPHLDISPSKFTSVGARRVLTIGSQQLHIVQTAHLFREEGHHDVRPVTWIQIYLAHNSTTTTVVNNLEEDSDDRRSSICHRGMEGKYLRDNWEFRNMHSWVSGSSSEKERERLSRGLPVPGSDVALTG